jgi:hypothetical protein
MPSVRPRLGKLQTNSALLVVRRGLPEQGVSQKKELLLPLQHAATVGWRKEKAPSRKLSGLQTREGGNAEEKVAEDTEEYNGKGVLFLTRH